MPKKPSKRNKRIWRQIILITARACKGKEYAFDPRVMHAKCHLPREEHLFLH